MTGYGRSERETRAVSAETEMRSVNSRHLTVRCRVPGDWVRLETKLESLIKQRIRRGTVDVFLRVKVLATPSPPRVDHKVLAVYRRALEDLGGGDRAELLRLPGVITLEDPQVSTRSVERTVVAAAREALDALVASREAEGERLVKALRRELAGVARNLRAVERLLPRAVADHQRALHRRLDALLGTGRLETDDPALLREVAVLADRADVTEEVDRLHSHLAGAERLLEGGGPTGKELDFLLQEVGREVNTLGAKSADVRITSRVVQLKSGVERMREQAANIE